MDMLSGHVLGLPHKELVLQAALQLRLGWGWGHTSLPLGEPAGVWMVPVPTK